MKKLVLFFFEEMSPVHLKKDVVLFPIYLKKYFDLVEIVYFDDSPIDELPNQYRGVKFIKLEKRIHFKQKRFNNYLNRKLQEKTIKQYIRQNSDITHVMMFHFLYWHLSLARNIKKISPHIKIYLKLDTDSIGSNVIKNVIKGRGFRNKIFKKTHIKNINAIDLFTIESNFIKEELIKFDIFSNKLFYAPNGFDDDLLSKQNSFSKDKEIVTVGRLGTYQKNTELFLKTLENIDLKDWKVTFVGPIEDRVRKSIDLFYSKYPEKKNQVYFTGPINDTEELLNIYKRSSVFVLTSRYESSALVLIEAAINGCYIISTDVGAIRDLSSENNYCFICPYSSTGSQDESEIELNIRNKLSNIINNPSICYESLINRVDYYRKNFLMSNIINKDFYRSFSQ